RLVNAVALAVDPHPDKPGAADLLPERVVLLLAFALQRGHDVELRALGQRQHLVHDFVGGLRADPLPARWAVPLAESGVQDAEVVVDFRDRADGAPRALARRLLLDADRGREPRDVLDLRLLHLAEELAGIAGERLDVAPLPLRVDRVQRQRRL